MHALIILNGQRVEDHILHSYVQYADLIICADGGALWAIDASIHVDVVIGDMDSLLLADQEAYLSSIPTVIRYPSEKDETDGMAALDYAISQEADHITFFGMDGGRLDHQLANLMLLKRALNSGIQAEAIIDQGMVSLHNEYVQLPVEEGQTVSILPFNGDAIVNGLDGLQYTLDGQTRLTMDNPLGISNVATNNYMTVQIQTGCVLIFRYNID